MRNTQKIPEFREKDLHRFWEKVAITANPNSCWEWQSAKGKYGYGRFSIKSTAFLAARLAFFIHTKIDPSELHVLHRCDNPPCCNPNHLFLGTAKDNMDDMRIKGRKVPRTYTEEDLNKIRGSANRYAKLTEEQVVEIVSVYLKGSVTHLDLAKKYNVSQGTIKDVIVGKTWKHLCVNVPESERIKMASKNRCRQKEQARIARTKLTEVQVIEIVNLYLQGNHSHSSLANKYNIAKDDISKILKGVTWKHLNISSYREEINKISYRNKELRNGVKNYKIQ